MLTPARLITDAPTTWETHEGLSNLEYWGLLAGAPIALFAVIWVFSLVISRNNYVPPAPSTEVERHSGH